MELVHFDGILVKDGVMGGCNGALHRRWQDDGSLYNKDIAGTMSLSRFGEVKRSMKLCHNNSCAKKGQEGSPDKRQERSERPSSKEREKRHKGSGVESQE